MKRILSLVLSLSMLFAMATTAFAADYIAATSEAKLSGRLIKQDGTLSSATISDIDALIHKRNEAILKGNEMEAKEFEEKLYALGAYKSTQEEIMAVADKTSTSSVAPRASSNVTYITTPVYYAYANGTRYEVKRTDALPTTNSNLFHSASVNNKTTSSSVASGTYELCKVLGTLAAGAASPIAEACISAYEAFSSVISGFSPSTVVYGITASYSCAALEQVSFYQYKTTSGYWTPFASSSYIQTGFSSTIFSTDYSGGSKQGLNMNVESITDTIYSTYSYDSSEDTGYDTDDMLERYFTSYIFDKKSQVTGVLFYHDANGTTKTIKSLGMLCPTTTTDIT